MLLYFPSLSPQPKSGLTSMLYLFLRGNTCLSYKLILNHFPIIGEINFSFLINLSMRIDLMSRSILTNFGLIISVLIWVTIFVLAGKLGLC